MCFSNSSALAFIALQIRTLSLLNQSNAFSLVSLNAISSCVGSYPINC